jgi:hypothetical protein
VVDTKYEPKIPYFTTEGQRLRIKLLNTPTFFGESPEFDIYDFVERRRR